MAKPGQYGDAYGTISLCANSVVTDLTLLSNTKITNSSVGSSFMDESYIKNSKINLENEGSHFFHVAINDSQVIGYVTLFNTTLTNKTEIRAPGVDLSNGNQAWAFFENINIDNSKIYVGISPFHNYRQYPYNGGVGVSIVNSVLINAHSFDPITVSNSIIENSIVSQASPDMILPIVDSEIRTSHVIGQSVGQSIIKNNSSAISAGAINATLDNSIVSNHNGGIYGIFLNKKCVFSSSTNDYSCGSR